MQCHLKIYPATLMQQVKWISTQSPLLISLSGPNHVLHEHEDQSPWKITSSWTAAGKTHIGAVNLLYIIMFKIRKIKPNAGSVRQKPKSFHGDWKWRSIQFISITILKHLVLQLSSKFYGSALNFYGVIMQYLLCLSRTSYVLHKNDDEC